MQALSCVLDIGSYHVQCGVDHREFIPRSVFRNVLLYPPHDHDKNNNEISKTFESTSERSLIKIGDYEIGKFLKQKVNGTIPNNFFHYPIQHGQVQHWEDFEHLLHFIYESELRILSEDHPCIMTHSCLPILEKKKILNLMFESFLVPKFYLANKALCSLLRSGSNSGLEVSSGHDMTCVIPIHEGVVLSHAVVKTESIGGRVMNEHLEGLFTECLKATSEEWMPKCSFLKDQWLAKMKENFGFYISQDYESELALKQQELSNCREKYQLPDGNEILLDSRMKFQACEIIFQPQQVCSKTSIPTQGLHEMIYQCVQQCHVDLRSTLYSNIVLSGGNTMFTGIDTRLRNELNSLVPTDMNVHVNAPQERNYSVWMGALAIARCSQNHDLWVTLEEFNEFGETIAHRKLIMT
ncbi:hypothetical protein C9374_013073 [Naegleria lovaniensis]|uniref:Actin n=1 Tax=Naegleria lovaniensis TaxID=51637 RepID=A0AA88GA08_NAELO|nr:uncharacterized protein C9374_013073 [Naegleria lovaniensis]KAG2372866.1 hypothetical protein C9374_013073 [Naegleria lovaniensis]